MKPARPQDLFAIRELWKQLAQQGEREPPPSQEGLARLVAGFEWETRSRVVCRDGRVVGCVLVSDRMADIGRLGRLEAAALDPDVDRALLAWATRAARDLEVDVASVWRRRGRPGPMAELGFTMARPFLRLDRADLNDIPCPPWPSSYRLVTYATTELADTLWLDVFNSAFMEHWRHTPVHFESWRKRLRGPDADPNLYLMAMAADGRPAAIAICLLRPADEWNPHPTGIVESVGTMRDHRRRGLGTAMTAEGLRRLRNAGARSACLYVDGLNPTHAPDIYFRLGFAVGWEYEVWERPLGDLAWSGPGARPF